MWITKRWVGAAQLRTTRRNTHFEDAAPVFALIIESLIENLHYLIEVVSVHVLSAKEDSGLTRRGTNAHIIGHLRDLIHPCARGAPWIVGSGLDNFSLYVRDT